MLLIKPNLIIIINDCLTRCFIEFHKLEEYLILLFRDRDQGPIAPEKKDRVFNFVLLKLLFPILSFYFV